MTARAFQKLILTWYRKNGRHDLPWRPPSLKLREDNTLDPYCILISEVMLQQTQVSRVIPKYAEFLRVFPTIQTLAASPFAATLRVWQGLGYNRRAVHLKRTAETIIRDYHGRAPKEPHILKTLPGIGPGTAGAIAAFAFNVRVAFIETNIRRVYLHFFFQNRRRVHDREILAKIEATLPDSDAREWYYALMDYGSGALKTVSNPNRQSKHYARQAAFKGSRRELRGKIVGWLAEHGALAEGDLKNRIHQDGSLNTIRNRQFRDVIRTLAAEGLVSRRRNMLTIPNR